MRVGPQRRLRTEELMLSNCGAGKTLESLLDCKEIKSINPKGKQPWIFIGRTVAEAEVPQLCSPDAKSQLIGKDPDARKDWRQKGKEVAEDEVVIYHHQLNGHESEQTSEDRSQHCWWTGKPGVLHSMGSQRVRHNWVTELNWMGSSGGQRSLACCSP